MNVVRPDMVFGSGGLVHGYRGFSVLETMDPAVRRHCRGFVVRTPLRVREGPDEGQANEFGGCQRRRPNTTGGSNIRDVETFPQLGHRGLRRVWASTSIGPFSRTVVTVGPCTAVGSKRVHSEFLQGGCRSLLCDGDNLAWTPCHGTSTTLASGSIRHHLRHASWVP